MKNWSIDWRNPAFGFMAEWMDEDHASHRLFVGLSLGPIHYVLTIGEHR